MRVIPLRQCWGQHHDLVTLAQFAHVQGQLQHEEKCTAVYKH